MSDTIAAVSTGMQVSAIGIVRLSGDDAIKIADRLFLPQSGKKMRDCADRQLVFGSLTDACGETLDICLCTVSRAPHSYTGEDTTAHLPFYAQLSTLFSHSAQGRHCPANLQSARF